MKYAEAKPDQSPHRSGSHPQGVRAFGAEDPFDQIGMPLSGRVSLDGLTLLAPAQPLDARQAHQAATRSRPTSWSARRAAFKSLRNMQTRKFSVHSSTRAWISPASRTALAEGVRDLAA